MVELLIKKSDIEKLLKKEFGNEITFSWKNEKEEILKIEVDLDIIKTVLSKPETNNSLDKYGPTKYDESGKPAELLSEEEKQKRLEKIKNNAPLVKSKDKPRGVMGQNNSINPHKRDDGRKFSGIM